MLSFSVKGLVLLLCISAATAIAGCSSPNSEAIFDPDTGKHVAGWMTGSPIMHGATAEKDFSVCRSCHGDDYRGGTVKISCYGCHDGPGLNHPNPGWVVPLSTPITDPYHKIDPANCTKCHGLDYLGGGSHVACIDCHMNSPSSVHLTTWTSVLSDHPGYVGTFGTFKCQNGYCHGSPWLTVDVWNSQSGPHCNGSCHGWPPGG